MMGSETKLLKSSCLTLPTVEGRLESLELSALPVVRTSAVRSSYITQGKRRSLNLPPIPDGVVLSLSERQERDELIARRRGETLIGRTVEGTVVIRQRGARTTHWIRWNRHDIDKVYIPAPLAERVLEGVVSGVTQVECTITGLGPPGSSGWCQHPECEDCRIVPQAPRAERRSAPGRTNERQHMPVSHRSTSVGSVSGHQQRLSARRSAPVDWTTHYVDFARPSSVGSDITSFLRARSSSTTSPHGTISEVTPRESPLRRSARSTEETSQPESALQRLLAGTFAQGPAGSLRGSFLTRCSTVLE